jgi:hypothetical protein
MIRTAKLYHSDDEKFVLVMEDAGLNTKSLTKYLEKGPNLIEDEVLLEKIASDIHEFCVYLNDKSGITLATHRDQLENRESSYAAYAQLRTIFEGQSKAFNLEVELAPSVSSFWKALRPFDDPDVAKSREGLKQVFIFGDMWPNSILFDRERKLLWVIDWELARFETATNDLEELMSMLWLFKQNEAIFSAKSIAILMGKLQLAFFGDEKKDWRSSCGPYANDSFLFWVTLMVGNPDFKFEDHRSIVLKALEQVRNK